MVVKEPSKFKAAVGEPWPRWFLITSVVLSGLFVVFALFQLRKGVLDSWSRARVLLTHRRILALSQQIERMKTGNAYPTMCSLQDLLSRTPTLPSEVFRDAWDRPLIVRATAKMYVVMSLGSDGRTEKAYIGTTFPTETGDAIYSNGQWVRNFEGFATGPDEPPEPAVAIAEAAVCPE